MWDDETGEKGGHREQRHTVCHLVAAVSQGGEGLAWQCRNGSGGCIKLSTERHRSTACPVCSRVRADRVLARTARPPVNSCGPGMSVTADAPLQTFREACGIISTIHQNVATASVMAARGDPQSAGWHHTHTHTPDTVTPPRGTRHGHHAPRGCRNRPKRWTPACRVPRALPTSIGTPGTRSGGSLSGPWRRGPPVGQPLSARDPARAGSSMAGLPSRAQVTSGT